MVADAPRDGVPFRRDEALLGALVCVLPLVRCLADMCILGITGGLGPPLLLLRLTLYCDGARLRYGPPLLEFLPEGPNLTNGSIKARIEPIPSVP